MPRTIDVDVQAALEKTGRSELLLVFLTVTDPNVAAPIRVVCEEQKGVSFANGRPINYALDGDLYYAIPFSFSRLSDDDRPARAALNVPAFSTQIGDWLRGMTDPARLRVAIYAQSGWDDDVETTNNSRSPSGTPELIYDADHMFMRSANGGKVMVQCEVGGYDLSQEPLGPRATKDLCPDLYR